MLPLYPFLFKGGMDRAKKEMEWEKEGREWGGRGLFRLLLLLACAKSHMLSASRQQPHLLHVSAVDHRQTWSVDKS